MNHVLYYRTRPSEPRPNAEALAQQKREAHRIASGRHKIVGQFEEIERAAPGDGANEARPALEAAVALAAETKRREGRCYLTILRVDAIGRGDEFDVNHPLMRDKEHDEITLIERRCWTQMDDFMVAEYCHTFGKPLPPEVRNRMKVRQDRKDAFPVPADLSER
jgi:hypothetical protein